MASDAYWQSSWPPTWYVYSGYTTGLGGGCFAPARECLPMSGDIFWVSQLEGCHWHLVGKVRVLLNILQCTGPPPRMKNYPAPIVNSAEVGKPGFRGSQRTTIPSPSSSPFQLTDIRNSKVKEGSYIWLLSDLILKCQYTSSFPWHLYIRVMSFVQYLFPKVDFVEKH